MQLAARPLATEQINSPPRWGRSDWLLLAALVGGYLILQTFYLQPAHPFDPANYFFSALALPDVPADLFTLRIGLLLPVWAATEIFGTSEASLYLVPYLVGTVLVASSYGLARALLGNRAVAFAAAALVVANPYVLSNSSFLFPDLAATAVFTAGFFCVVWACTLPRQDKWANLFLVAGGSLLGWSYLIREFTPLLFPLVLLVAILYRLPWRRLLRIAGAALGVFGLELLWGAMVYGNPLIHATMLLDRQTSTQAPHKLAAIARVREQLETPFDAVLTFPRLLLEWEMGWIILALAAILLVATFVTRQRGLVVLSVWAFGYWALLSALGAVVPPNGGWILNITNLRYWSPIFPPLIIGGIGGLYLLSVRLSGAGWAFRAGRGITVAMAGAVAFVGVFQFHSDPALGLGSTHPLWDELRGVLERPAAQGAHEIWSDPSTSRLLPLYTHTPFGSPVWEGEAKSFYQHGSGFAAVDDLEGDLVVVHTGLFEGHFRRVFTGAGRSVPDYLIDPPDNWSLLLASSDGVLLLYAVEPGQRSMPVVSAGVDERGPWVVAPHSGFGLEPGRPISSSSPSALALASKERAFVRSSWETVEQPEPGSHLRIDARLGTDGRGRMRVMCLFSARNGNATVEATSAHSGPSAFRAAEFACQIPPELQGQLRLAVEFRFWGPLDVELGDMEAVLTGPVTESAG